MQSCRPHLLPTSRVVRRYPLTRWPLAVDWVHELTVGVMAERFEQMHFDDAAGHSSP